MPHGRSPTGTFAFTVRDATSTMETSLDGPFAVNTVLPSGDTAMPHGRSPTSIDAICLFVAVSRMTTFLPRPVVTKTNLPSGDATTPIGRTSCPPVSLMVCLLYTSDAADERSSVD